MALNVFAGCGRLTADPVVKKTTNQKSVVDFTVAIDSSRKNPDGSKHTDFIRCRAWSQSADYLGTYAHKGDMVSVNGRMTTETYVAKDGKNATFTFVNVDNVNIVSSNANRSVNQQPAGNGYQNQQPAGNGYQNQQPAGNGYQNGYQNNGYPQSPAPAGDEFGDLPDPFLADELPF